MHQRSMYMACIMMAANLEIVPSLARPVAMLLDQTYVKTCLQQGQVQTYLKELKEWKISKNFSEMSTVR